MTLLQSGVLRFRSALALRLPMPVRMKNYNPSHLDLPVTITGKFSSRVRKSADVFKNEAMAFFLRTRARGEAMLTGASKSKVVQQRAQRCGV